MIPGARMDLLIAISQGLGLAVAAGFVGAAPVALGATGASVGVADDAAGVADDGWLIALAWVATAVELAADAVWPGAQAGIRLARKAVGGGLAFGLVTWDELPWISLLLGAVVAAGVAVALRHVRAGAVKAGGDLRGTALIEDASGVAASAIALVPFVGYLMAAAGGVLVARARRREQEKYKGLRVLR
jgi:hypothetical protein